MKEYICSECKDQNNTLATEQGDVSYYQGMPVREEISVCPNCGSTEVWNISEIMQRVECVLDDYELNWEDLQDLMEEKL